MQLITDRAALLAALSGRPRAAFVPTMGALHDGHASLLRRAAELGPPVVASIFVNPSQFAPDEDLDRYPRTLEADLAICQASGVDIVFGPDVATVYPPEEAIPVPPLPEVARNPGLEDAYRPGHFEGVCQVVARLFDLVPTRVAVFGEKDYQQLLVVSAMVAASHRTNPDRWPDLRIEPGATVREPDGLAMSSRNTYLDAEQRDCALGLNRALQAAAAANHPATAEQMMRETLAAHGLETDYAVVRDATTLRPVESFARATRGLIAARLGPIRLIDNRALPVWS